MTAPSPRTPAPRWISDRNRWARTQTRSSGTPTALHTKPATPHGDKRKGRPRLTIIAIIYATTRTASDLLNRNHFREVLAGDPARRRAGGCTGRRRPQWAVSDRLRSMTGVQPIARPFVEQHERDRRTGRDVSTPRCTAPNASGPPLLRRSAHRGALADAVISTSRAISPTFRTSRPAEATRTTKFITNGPSGWAMIWSSESCSPTSSKSLGAQAHCCSGPARRAIWTSPDQGGELVATTCAHIRAFDTTTRQGDSE
jgi:hypothetical protein